MCPLLEVWPRYGEPLPRRLQPDSVGQQPSEQAGDASCVLPLQCAILQERFSAAPAKLFFASEVIVTVDWEIYGTGRYCAPEKRRVHRLHRVHCSTGKEAALFHMLDRSRNEFLDKSV